MILGWKAALASAIQDAAPSVTQRFERIFGRPTLTELQDESGSFWDSSRQMVQAAMGLEDAAWDRIEREFEEIERRLAVRREHLSLAYPSYFVVERETSLLLYSLTRLLRPRCIIETGVADGLSTLFFLAALERNSEGQLHSIDIASDVGALVESSDRWHLHLCDIDQIERQVLAIFAREGPVDLFFHDSDHRFFWQLFEYEAFAANASEGALLLSDDVEMSHAFEVFCRTQALVPNYLFDARKVAGMVWLNAPKGRAR